MMKRILFSRKGAKIAKENKFFACLAALRGKELAGELGGLAG
jgi:hypothetical protein